MIYDWPHDAPWTPESGSFRLSSISALSSSPYTGAHKAASLGQIWVAKFNWNNTHLDQTQDMQGFLDMLEGPVNPVRLFDWWRSAPKLLSGGSSPFSDDTYFDDGSGFTDGYEPLLIANAAQGTNVLTMEGLPVSTTCFLRGDLIGVGGYLYEVKIGGNSNSSGQAAVTVHPGLRVGAAIGDPVTLYRPTLAMRLASDSEAVISRAITHGLPFSLTFVEDIP